MIKRNSFAIFAVVLLCSSSMLVVIDDFNSNKSTITYIVDGIEYSTQEIINNTLIKHPDVPKKPGFTGEWDIADQKINGNTVVNAVYTRFAYVIKFETDYPEFFDTYVYDTKNYDNKTHSTYGYSKDSITGKNLLDGNGQLNFELNLDPNIDATMEIEGDFNNIKTSNDDDQIKDNCYRITKIASDIIVKLTPKIKIAFSHQPGFYDDEFDLTLNSIGEIHYTTDCTEPTLSSPIYSEPIHITDASLNDNVYSMREDISAGYLTGLYSVPDHQIDKCTTVRVASYYNNQLLSDVVGASYFVNFEKNGLYDDMKIISIITDPDNLFDTEHGIYVIGENYQDIADSMDYYQDSWWWSSANFNQKGMDWERKASIQVFGEDKGTIVDQDIGIRIHGGWSRWYSPHSLNLYARNEYGQNRFNINLFGDGFNPQRLTLSQGGQDNITMVKDKIVSDFTSHYNISTMNYELCALFLEGEFWGYYWITEKIDEEYLNYHYKVDKDQTLMVKNAQIEVGDPEDNDAFTEYINLTTIETNNRYEELSKYIDMESFVDYYAIELYITNWDWTTRLNYAFWKTKYVSDGTYEDSRWRYVLFDCNCAYMSSGYSQFDSIDWLLNNTDRKDPLFIYLMEDGEFRDKLKSKLMEVSETFNPSRTDEYLDNYYAKMQTLMINQYSRFFEDENGYMDYFTLSISDIKLFFHQRYDYIRDLCANNLGYA